MLNWLPTYFNRAKGIDFDHLGWPLALVFAAGIAGIILMAYLGDKLQRRTLLAGVSFLVAGVMVHIALSVNTLELLVLFFAIAVFFQGAYVPKNTRLFNACCPPTGLVLVPDCTTGFRCCLVVSAAR